MTVYNKYNDLYIFTNLRSDVLEENFVFSELKFFMMEPQLYDQNLPTIS